MLRRGSKCPAQVSTAGSVESANEGGIMDDTEEYSDTSSEDDEESRSLRSDDQYEPDIEASVSPSQRRRRKWLDRGVSFRSVLLDEKKLIDDQFLKRGLGVRLDDGGSFSVAFSGGGVRAAAFQAGVLWQLAQAGCLSKVEHFVAVSGGAYVTCAFASHLVAAEQPTSPDEVNQWYKGVVAKTVCRMQRNVGYFVRDWSRGPFAVPKDGSGLLPPIADIPMLVAVIFFTLLSNPLTHFVVYLVPLTECVNQFMGMSLRAAYCAPSDVAAWRIFEWWGPLHSWVWNIILLLSFTFCAWILGKLPVFRPPTEAEINNKDKLSGSKRPWYCRLGYLYLQSLRAATTRILVIYSLIVLVLCGILSTELWDPLVVGVSNQSRRSFCADYIRGGGRNPATLGYDLPQCDDMRIDSSGRWGPWWEDAVFDVYRQNTSWPDSKRKNDVFAKEPALDLLPKEETKLFQFVAWPFHQRIAWSGSSFCISMIFLLVLVLGVALVLTPIFNGLFLFCVSLVGPTVALLLAASWMQYRIFGPLTGQYYVRLFELWPFNRGIFLHFRLCCLVLAFVLMVFFHGIHFASHYFYTRSLRLAYFEDGRDVPFKELKQNPFCPFILLTGTIVDWRRPGDREGITEISMSALHTGSAKTGYITTPPWRSVAKCTALAAAATDAFILGMFDRLRYRFWLEFLNLRMGDYLLFERWRNPCVAWCQKRTSSCRRESVFFYEFPVVAGGGSAFVFFILASIQSQSEDPSACNAAYHMYVVSLYIVIILFFLSFFGFIPVLEFFVHSPMIRQIHMALRYYHVSETPPSMIYVSDGGVQDCTGIIQLMHRRCARILLALAAADSEDALGALREAIKLAVKKKLGSFYDPKDPRRDVSSLLDEFKENKNQTYLHIGIRYGWGRSDNCARRQTGHLIVVKNRLPTEMESLPVDPSLTEDELTNEPRPLPSDMTQQPERRRSWDSFSMHANSKHVMQDDLAGCCCNCCHVTGCNLGPKFPHVPNANQCLTPALFSSLCRLGFRLSKDAVDLISQRGSFKEPWELSVS